MRLSPPRLLCTRLGRRRRARAQGPRQQVVQNALLHVHQHSPRLERANRACQPRRRRLGGATSEPQCAS